MFDNLLGQDVAGRLIGDIENEFLVPSMLFSGPPCSGKGTAALELGRIISCENNTERAAWNCQCPSCTRHRLLAHTDLLCFGPRNFSAEIAASAGTFLRDPSLPASRTLFIRAMKKLLIRFNTTLLDDDSKAGKLSQQVYALEEDLDETEKMAQEPSINTEALAKLCEGMIKNAIKLESEGISDNIPIGHIRKASAWCHLAPMGRGKLLIIENADRMLEEARNSMLKLLEEPPPRVTIVLTTPRPGSLLATILSRLRPYRFAARTAADEADVIRRVFRDEGNGRSINSYLDSFLPVSGETLKAAAAFFAASIAFRASVLCNRRGRPIPNEVVLLGKYCAPLAEAAGLGRPQGEAAAVLSLLLEKTERFEIRSLFARFLSLLLESASLSQRSSAPSLAYNGLWSNCAAWSETSVGIYNLRASMVLEKLFTDLSRGLADL